MLRKQRAVVKALVGAGFPLTAENTRGWLPLEEAVALRDRCAMRFSFTGLRL